MKRLFALLVFLAAMPAMLPVRAQTPPGLQITFQNAMQQPQVGRTINISYGNAPTVNNSNIVLSDLIQLTTDSTGSVYVTNAVSGMYGVTALAPPSKTFCMVNVISNLTTTVNATNFTISPTNTGLYISNGMAFPAGYAWSAATSDARYILNPHPPSGDDGYVLTWSFSGQDWYAAPAGAASQTPWAQNINGNGFSLYGVLGLTNTGPVKFAGITGGSGYFAALDASGNVTAAIPAGGGGGLYLNPTNGNTNANSQLTLTNVPAAIVSGQTAYSVLANPTGNPTLPNVFSSSPILDGISSLGPSYFSSITVTNPSVFNNSLTVDGLFIITNALQNTNAGFTLQESSNGVFSPALPFHGTTINEANIYWFHNALNPNYNTTNVSVLITGDSTMDTSQGSINVGLANVFQPWMAFGGGLGSWAAPENAFFPYMLPTTGAGGVTLSSAPDTNWYGQYYFVSNGAFLTNITWNGTAYAPQINADTIRVAYVIGPSESSSFTVFAGTNFGGPLTALATITAYNATYAARVTNLPASGYIFTVISNHTGVLKVIGASAMSLNTHSLIVDNFAFGGQHEMLWTNVQASVFTNIMLGLNPSMVLFQNKNEVATVLQAGYATNFLQNFWSNYVSNCSRVSIGTYATDNPYDDTGQNAAIRTACLQTGDAYIDCYNNMPSSNVINQLGWNVDGTHTYPQAYYMGGFVAQEIFSHCAAIPWFDTNYFRGTINQTAIAATVALGKENGPASALKLWYPLDEGSGTNVGDASGNGYAGYNLLGTGWVAGKMGRAYNSASSSDYIEVSNTAVSANTLSWMTNGFTVSMWVNTTGTINGSHYLYLANKQNNTPYELNSFFTGPTALFVVVQYPAAGGNTAILTATTPSVSDGYWHFIAITYDNTNLSAMFDGVGVGSVAGGGPVPLSVNPLLFNLQSYNISTAMDDIRMYSPPLTTNQLAQLFWQGQQTSPLTNFSAAALTNLTGSNISNPFTNLTVSNNNLAADIVSQMAANSAIDPWQIFSNGTEVASWDHYGQARAAMGSAAHVTYGFYGFGGTNGLFSYGGSNDISLANAGNLALEITNGNVIASKALTASNVLVSAGGSAANVLNFAAGSSVSESTSGTLTLSSDANLVLTSAGTTSIGSSGGTVTVMAGTTLQNSAGDPALFSANSLPNNGANLTNLNASQLTSGTVPGTQLPNPITNQLATSAGGQITLGGNAVTTNGGLVFFANYSPGTNLLINMAPYTNVANLVFGVQATNSMLQITFTNAPSGLSFALVAFNGPGLTNGVFFNTALAATNLSPVRWSTNAVASAIPTTSTNSSITTVFTVIGTNVYEMAQTSHNF